MSLVTAKDIMDAARESYLNDAPAILFTDAKLLPLLKMVHGFLETTLEENNIPCKHEIAPVKIIATGETGYLPLPKDMIWPIKLEERLSGSSDLFQPMTQKRWEPQLQQTDKLSYWVWRLDEIKFLGATTDREVLLYYQKTFPSVEDVDQIVYGKAEQYLAAKLAAMAHMFIQQNETLASICDKTAQGNLDQIINIQTKKSQSLPVRRRPYIPFR
jgi:hypothetical protein